AVSGKKELTPVQQEREVVIARGVGRTLFKEYFDLPRDTTSVWDVSLRIRSPQEVERTK
ncbi:hypothetical protein GIB67_021462, partial [Kingdonia uniflora]